MDIPFGILFANDPPLWAIYAGQVMGVCVLVLCTFLILKRLNYFTSILLQQTITVTEEGKQATILAAKKLADKQIEIADSVHKKLENEATTVKEAAGIVAHDLATERQQIADLVNEKLDKAARSVKDTALLVAQQVASERNETAYLINRRLDAAAEDVKNELTKAALQTAAEFKALREELKNRK